MPGLVQHGPPDALKRTLGRPKILARWDMTPCFAAAGAVAIRMATAGDGQLSYHSGPAAKTSTSTSISGWARAEMNSRVDVMS